MLGAGIQARHCRSEGEPHVVRATVATGRDSFGIGRLLVAGVTASSRAATDELLAGLRDGRWRPRAWGSFLERTVWRSAEQAWSHPRALVEVTLLHAVLAAVGRRKRKAWTLTSWALAATHLGMLEHRRSIGLASVVTLTRANLPVLGDHRLIALVALGTDLADGRIARRLGAVSPFGSAADSLADAAFWVWFVHRHEPSRRVRAAALAAWAAPVVAITVASVRRGQMVDAPRPSMLRPAAALQAILTARAVLRGARGGSS
jgi:hypothetical protein